MLRLINYTERLYVYESNGYVSTLGFVVLNGRHARLAAEFGLMAPTECGTEKAFNDYMTALEYAHKTGLVSFCELSPQLVGLEGRKVRVRRLSGESRTFRVGKSTGWQPIHLECYGTSEGNDAADRHYAFVQLA